MNITGGKYKGIKLNVPSEKIARPTLSKVRMSVFNSLRSMFQNFDKMSFLDMFGGSGIMGLEALSRGFGQVTVFEKNKKAAEIIKSNYKILGLKPDLHIGESVKLIKDRRFDVVYIDPPYAEKEIYKLSLSAVLKCGLIVLEHSDEINFSDFDIIKQKKFGTVYITFLKTAFSKT